MVYDTTTGIIISILINQNPAQAFQVSIQLLSTLINYPIGLTENTIIDKLITVYPNPTNELVHIEIPDQTIANIKVYNMQGQIIKETTESRLDLSSYSNGMYFLKALTEKGIYSYKLIKQ